MLFKPYVINYSVERNELVVHLHGRDGEGERRSFKLYGAQPHFYGTDIPDHNLITDAERDAAETLRGDSIHRLETEFPFHVPKVRDECGETHEDDVYFSDRVRYDHGIKGAIRVPDTEMLSPGDIEPLEYDESHDIEPRVCVFDIEVDSRQQFHGPDTPAGEVLSIAAWDSYQDSYVLLINGNLNRAAREKAMRFFKENEWKVQVVTCDNERELFALWKQFLATSQPDILAGWNSSDMPGNNGTDGYDVPYLKQRAEMNGFPAPDWREFEEFDLMDAYARMQYTQLESKGLDYVSQEEGLEGKTSDEAVWELYEKDRGNFSIYNVSDVYLTKEVMQRANVLGFWEELSEFAGCSLQSSIAAGRVVDAFVFHWLSDDERVLPSRGKAEGLDLGGGEVLDPSDGVFRHVVEIDLSSQYPNAMRTFNLSPDAKVGEDFDGPCFEMPSGQRYRKDKRGIIPHIIDELINLRAEKRSQGKDLEQRVIKEVANSIYGNIGSRYSRFRDPHISNDITASSRQLIRWIADRTADMGDRPLYGDTDSVFFLFADAPPDYHEVRDMAQERVEKLNKNLHRFAQKYGWEEGDELHLELDVEHVYDSWYQPGAKKTYVAAYRDPEGDVERNGYRYSLKVRGFDLRQSNAANITKRLQKEVLVELLFDSSLDDIVDYIQDEISEMKDGNIPHHDLLIPTGWNKQNYKTTPEHVRAAKWSNKHLGKNFGPGDKPCVLPAHIEGKPRTDVLALEWGDDLPDGTVIDWDEAVRKTILQPMSNVLEPLGIRERDLLRPTEDAESFF